MKQRKSKKPRSKNRILTLTEALERQAFESIEFRAKSKRPRSFVPSEDYEAKTFVRWLELKHPEIKFSHLPLETRTDVVQSRKNKLLGVRRGVPDYLLIAGAQLFFIELKRRRGGRVSPEQQDWIDALAYTESPCFVAYGAAEAKEIVEQVIKFGVNYAN